MTILSIDGGRSRCRARLRPTSGAPAEATGPALPGLGGAASLPGILRAVDEALARLPSHQADVTVAGLAGVLAQWEHAPALAEALAARTGARRVVVTGDLVTAHAGALRLEPGVVLAAGTGAVAFAVGPDGRTARADGWGPLLGDEGSGFWIARAGLAAALAHRDGRGGSGVLRARAEALYGPLERLAQVVHHDGAPIATIAWFASEVAAAAREGDTVAAGLWIDAGRRLAATAVAAAEQVLRAAPLSYTGGLFDAGELLLEPLRAELARRSPRLTVWSPAGTALDGAELLATRYPLPRELGYVHVLAP